MKGIKRDAPSERIETTSKGNLVMDVPCKVI